MWLVTYDNNQYRQQLRHLLREKIQSLSYCRHTSLLLTVSLSPSLMLHEWSENIFCNISLILILLSDRASIIWILICCWRENVWDSEGCRLLWYFNFIMKMKSIRHCCMKTVYDVSPRPSACKFMLFCAQSITVIIDDVLNSIGVCAAPPSPYILAW